MSEKVPNGVEQMGSRNLENQESREAEVVRELLELTSSNENFRFGISANGRLAPDQGGRLRGQFAYLLDQKTKSLVQRDDPGMDPSIYERDGDTKTLYTPFLRASGTDILKYQGWINWTNIYDNEFTEETRNALTFAGGLFIRNSDEALEIVSEELFKLLYSPQAPESKAIMWKFFIDSFRKHVPEYWAFVEEMWKEQPGNEGKDIRNCFG